MSEQIKSDSKPLDTQEEMIRILREELKKGYYPALLGFWNYLMSNGFLLEGWDAKIIIEDYLNHYKKPIRK